MSSKIELGITNMIPLTGVILFGRLLGESCGERLQLITRYTLSCTDTKQLRESMERI